MKPHTAAKPRKASLRPAARLKASAKPAVDFGPGKAAQASRGAKPKGRRRLAQLDVGARNARIAIRMFVVIAICISILGLCSRCQGGSEGVMSLSDIEVMGVGDNSLDDPLALSDEPDFELLSISPDSKTIGYTSGLGTGRAAALLLQALARQGWQQADQPVDRHDGSQPFASAAEVVAAGAETITGPLAFTLSLYDLDGSPARQMVVQLFPTGDGSSIVVTVF
jgi:hypothetical protein